MTRSVADRPRLAGGVSGRLSSFGSAHSGGQNGAVSGRINERTSGQGLLGTLRMLQRTPLDSRNGLASQDDKPMASWSLLKLNPQKQNGYVHLLRELCPGVSVYYPVYTRMSRPHGMRRAMPVVRPVYPGYLFLMVGNVGMKLPVSLPVRARWVRFGGKVEEIPGFVVDRLRGMEQRNELVREVKYVNPYVAGARVNVHTPVQDILAVVVRLVGKNRVLVDTNVGRATVPIHAVKVL